MLLKESLQIPDIRAAAILETELRPVALLPPARQEHVIQGPLGLR